MLNTSDHNMVSKMGFRSKPQHFTYDFRTFSSSYGFHHTTSTPKLPQSNSESERAVQTIKTCRGR